MYACVMIRGVGRHVWGSECGVGVCGWRYGMWVGVCGGVSSACVGLVMLGVCRSGDVGVFV